MLRFPEGPIIIVALIALAVWLLVGLPLLYLPDLHIPHGLFEVKAGEFLIFAATVALWWATRQLVKGADHNAEKQLRAYVGLHSGETTLYPFENAGFTFISHVELRNYGQTPALELTIKSNVKIETPDSLPFDDFLELERGVPTVLFRDGAFHINLGFPIPESDWSAIRLREKSIFVWGRVDYKDVFGKAHFFSFELRSSHAQPNGLNIFNMEPHGRGFVVGE